MQQTSISMDLIPSVVHPDKVCLVVKRMDLVDGEWGNVQRLLDIDILLDTKDISEGQLPWFAVSCIQTGLRVFAAHVAAAGKASISFSNAQLPGE